MHKALKDLPEDVRAKLKKQSMPDWTSPMLATLTHDHFSDPDWIYERKLDGQRCLFFKNGDDIRLMSRNEKQQNEFYPEITEAVSKLSGDFILDGELVVFDGNVTSFSALQNRMHVRCPEEKLCRDYPVYCYMFDLLFLDHYDLSALPLVERKKVLRDAFAFKDPLRFLNHRRENGEDYLQEACEHGWEGLIAKDSHSSYQHSRSNKWLKFKCGKGQEFVIGGYTEPKGERIGFGALLIGYYQGNKLRYAGRVGTGYDDTFLDEFHGKMKSITRKTSPFENFDEKAAGDDITWVRPRYVGEIGFTEWTSSGKLRHPRFLGLRKDKAPEDVVKEEPRHASR